MASKSDCRRFIGDVHADVHTRSEDHTLGFHQREPPIEDALLHLEFGMP
jgi:hypothetical protein